MFDFTTVVSRENIGSLTEEFTPQILREKKIPPFNSAEMDFPTAPAVIRAMKDCVEKGLLGFTLPDEPYRSAVCRWMKNVRHADIRPEMIVPTLGTIFSLATCIRLAVSKGQNIIVQPPVYNRYKQAADRIGRGTVLNPLKYAGGGRYEMDLEDLERKMADPANTLLVICNPHNPLGRVWEKETLEQIARWAVKYNVLVYSDEIFADYSFDGHEPCVYTLLNGGKNNGISATSLGKTFSFTGVNHANMLIADEELRERFIRQRYSDHYGSLDPVYRAAVIGGYTEEGLAWKNEVQALIGRNYRRFADGCRKIFPGFEISPLEGGFITWADFSCLGMTEEELMDFFVEKAYFAPEPGSDFSADRPGLVRVSIATPEWVMEEAMQRLAAAANERSS